jgi:Uma2 family endonuclease
MSQGIVPESILHTRTERIPFPPSELWSDELPLESDWHRDQIELLIRLLRWYWRDRQDFYVTGNLTIYYSPNQRKSEDFRGPDFFVVLGTERRDRRSWTVRQEGGKFPNVIVELLSDSTASVDRGLKKEIYQDTFHTPEYFWFHPETFEFKGFHLTDGTYQEITPTPQGWLWSQELQLYLGVHENQLRFFTPSGALVLLPEQAMQEIAEQERQRAEQEHQRAETAEQEIEQLKALLRSQGLDPESE